MNRWLLLAAGVSAYYFRTEIESALGISSTPAASITAATTAAANATAAGASPATAAVAAATAAAATPPTPITPTSPSLAAKIYQAAATGLGGNIPIPASGLMNLYQWNFYYSLVTGLSGPDLTALLGPGETEVDSTHYLQALAARGLV
ncbi:MAG: hypothetical protein M3N93_11130 [Acidobacteriota bacterium]|nr:hypothetical protein [Acidobacteriota bacterium]